MMMKTLRSLILSLSAMLFMNAQSVWAVDCAEWNLAKDFRMSPNQENPNRDSCGNLGVWHFLQSGDFSHTPQTYTLMQNFSTSLRYDGTPGIHNWSGTEIPDVVVYKVEKDLNAAALAKYMYMHPGWSHLTIIGWRSPINGNVKINGEFASAYASGGGCGDGVKWYIDKGATTLASGSFPNGSSQNVQQGTNGSSLTSVSMQQGEFIYFILDYNTNAMCDATEFNVTISPVTACTDTNGSTQTGIDQCKANPASCGIPTVTDQCKTNPASCGLFTQAQIDAAKQTGIDLVNTRYSRKPNLMRSNKPAKRIPPRVALLSAPINAKPILPVVVYSRKPKLTQQNKLALPNAKPHPPLVALP